MKFSTLLAPFLALVFGGMAHAEVRINITGSTAFRAATMNGIKSVMNLTGVGTNSLPSDGYVSGTNFSAAGFAIFKGTLASNTALGHVTVKCDWSGSVAGIKAVSSGTPIRFPVDGSTVSPGGTQNLPTPAAADVESANVCMTDNFQGATKYTSPALTIDTTVGIVPFAFCAGKGAPAGLTNVTPQLVNALFKNGYLSASLFTNNFADSDDQVGGTRVFAIGRNPQSGTRVTLNAETGVGIFTVVAQNWPHAAGVPTTIAGFGADGLSSTAPAWTVAELDLTPADAAFDAPNLGDNGYDSGGTMADRMRADMSSVTDNTSGYSGKGCFVSFLGEADAVRVVSGIGSSATTGNAGNGRFLAYNGVAGWGGAQKSFTNAAVTVPGGVSTVTLAGADVTTGMVVGQFVKPVAGVIPKPAYVTSITDATHFTIAYWEAATTTAGTASTMAISTLLPESLRNGTYTAWGFEHLMYRSVAAINTGNPGASTVANAIATQIINIDYFASGYPLYLMRCTRNLDGETVGQNY